MVAQYNRALVDEQRKVEDIERWDHAVFRPHRLPTPSYLEHESFDQQQKRILDRVRPYVSEELQKIRTDDVFGSGLNHVARQYFDSAAAEAVRPTNVGEGTLKEVIRHDNTGRQYSEFYGSPSAWMKDFTGDRKWLTKINAPAYYTGFQKV
jgi:hypothetical protein